MPSPNSIAAAPVAAADSVTCATAHIASTIRIASAEGSGPTATSQGLRNAMNSSGRMTASEPTVFHTVFGAHLALRFDRDAMPARERHLERRQLLVVIILVRC